MKHLFLALISSCVLFSGHAQTILRTFDWEQLSGSGIALPGVVVRDDISFLRIESINDTGLRTAILEIENPPITKSVYAIRGKVRYENVEGDGFLEMWNFFPPAKPDSEPGRFFSRTLGESGDMGKLHGTSALRAFTLPFQLTGAPSKPTRLEINLVLPGSGVVFIGPLELVEYTAPAASGGMMGAWWSDQTAGWIGGIGGTLIGCLAALMGYLAAQRKARGFVTGIGWTLIGIGIALAIAAVVAFVTHQPYGVYYPLGLGAVLVLAILPARMRAFHRQYEDHELRKMAAADAIRS